jgi:hypothetical protein
MIMSNEESTPQVGFDADDAIDLSEDDLLDPDKSVVHFERRQEDDREFPDTYRNASIRELASGRETLSIELTLRQLQGWADTLGAKLSDERRRVGEDMATVEELYLIVKTQDGREVETMGAAFTRKAALNAMADLENELEEPWSQDIELRTTTLFTK